MDARTRQKALGIDPDDYFDVRSELLDNEDQLIEGARRLGIDSVPDSECGGEASIYLGDVPPENIREIEDGS